MKEEPMNSAERNETEEERAGTGTLSKTCPQCGRKLTFWGRGMTETKCEVCGREMHGNKCWISARRSLPKAVLDPGARFLNLKMTAYRVQCRDGSLTDNIGYRICDGCWQMMNDHNGWFFQKVRDYYHTTGRLEELATFYETFEMPEEAGRVRRKKSVEMKIDLNHLIEQLRDGGLTIPYRCRSCGATLTIDKNSNSDGLRFCSYCGSAIDTDTLGNLLKLALG